MKKASPVGYILAIVILAIATLVMMAGVIAVSKENAKLNKILDTACMATRTEYSLCKAGVEMLKNMPDGELEVIYNMYK